MSKSARLGAGANPQAGAPAVPAIKAPGVPSDQTQVEDAPGPAPQSDASTLESAKALVKLKIIDWVRQQTRDDPVSLALKMPWITARVAVWEDAKRSGDADAMTKAYTDLLRGIEA